LEPVGACWSLLEPVRASFIIIIIMSSLLSFAFRDNNKNNIKNNKNNNNNKSLKNRDIRIPDVEPSRSGDNVMSPTASMDLGEQQQATAQTTTPATPEGLKPRKSLKAIRRELGIPSLLPPSQQLLPPRPLMVHSPQVTNSSFYSRESATTTPSGKHSQRIAESPNLAAPTTAVGALVASTTHTNRAPAPLYHKPLLPPRHWLLDDDDVEEHLVVQQRSRQYYSHMHDDSFEPRTMQMQMQLRQYRQLDDDQSDDDQSSQDDDDHLRWQPLMESADTSSSFGASSQVGLVEERQATTGYNFDPILNLNVSAISKPADDQSSLHSLEAMQHQSMERDDEQDNYMLKRKRSNQRSQKERLVLDCMARLMADLDLVVAIETEDTATDWFLQTPMNEEGLLVGLEESTQTRLQTYLQSILNEMDTACPEEFFLSPTQIDTYGDTHQDLKQALQFILSILRIQGAENEWQCRYEVRTAMGLSNHAESKSKCCCCCCSIL
jgi:predicted RNA-binding protein Jag